MHTARTKYTRGTNTHDVQIGNRRLNISVALVVYRCEVCHGELRRKDNGLVCKANAEHRGFIHQKEAEAIQARQAKNIEQLSEIYTIKDGKVVLKCQS